MTTTRARHRAAAGPFHWATRSVVATAAVPVGALAGCLAAAASSSQPALGLAGMTVAAVPLALHAWHTRRAERAARPGDQGRHVLAAADVDEFFSVMSPSGELYTSAGVDRSWSAASVPAPRRALDAAPASTVAAAGADGHRRIDLRPDEDSDWSVADLDVEVWPTQAERDAEIAKLRRVWDASLPLPAAPSVQAGRGA